MLSDEEEREATEADPNEGVTAIAGCLAAILLWLIVMLLLAGVIKSCGIG